MVGEQVPSVDLSILGIKGDRFWAIRDAELGGIRGAKKIGELMQYSARRVGGGVEITCPDGSCFNSQRDDASSLLSTALGRSVRLEELPADGAVEHFRRGPSNGGNIMEEMRRVFGREPDEPLPDFSIFPAEVMEFESPPGTHHDCWPLMVMTTSALEALRSALPASVIDERRFRPSIVLNKAEVGHPEFQWKGRLATLGSTVVEFLDPCPRCVMVTRRISDALPQDRQILRHIVRDLNQCVGVYARVLKPGNVSVGDTMKFVS